jgi:hypothetical protein
MTDKAAIDAVNTRFNKMLRDAHSDHKLKIADIEARRLKALEHLQNDPDFGKWMIEHYGKKESQ